MLLLIKGQQSKYQLQSLYFKQLPQWPQATKFLKEGVKLDRLQARKCPNNRSQQRRLSNCSLDLNMICTSMVDSKPNKVHALLNLRVPNKQVRTD